MPNPLDRYRQCSQATAQERLDRAESRAFEAQQAFQAFTYQMPREEPLTTPQWQQFNRLYADVLNTGDSARHAFIEKQMCETRYTIPPRPQLEPPKTR